MWKKFICYLLFGGCLTFNGKSNIPFDHFGSITPAQGLADPVVYCFAQDTAGYIWIGTKGGLNRYDGYRFISYTHQEGDSTTLSHSRINCLTLNQGVLYVGTDRGVNIYDAQTGHFRQIRQTKDYSIKFMVRQADGAWWFGTNQGILYYDGKQVIRYSRQDQQYYFPEEYVPCGYVADDSVFYAGTHHYLCRYDGNDRFVNIPLPFSDRLKNNLLLSLIQDNENTRYLWLGTEQGLIHTDLHSGISQLYLPGTPIKSLLYDGNGNLWIGTDNGLYIKPALKTEFICKRRKTDNPYSLQNDVIWSLFQDREQNLWLGTDNGISIKQAKNSYTTYSIREITGSDEENILLTVHRDRFDRLWLGGSNGLICWDPATGNHRWWKAGEHSLSHNKVRFLYEDSLSLWIATDGGLNRYDYPTGKIVHYTIRDKNEAYNSRWMYCIAEDREGNLCLGTYEGGIFVVDKKNLPANGGTVYALDHFNSYTAVQAISSNIINSLILHPDGSLWAGTDNSGVNRISTLERKTTTFTYPGSGLSSNFIKSLAVDAAGDIWIGTDNGLNHIPASAGKAVAVEPEKITSPVRFLTVQDDNLWFGTNSGIACYNREKAHLTAVYSGQTYYTCAYYDSRKKQMYLGSPTGLTVFVPDDLLSPDSVPHLKMTGFIPDKSDLPEDLTNRQNIRLPYRQNSFSLEFSSFLYNNTSLRYAYRLKGYDDTWRELPGHQNRTTYMNVPAGDYTFEVCNINSDGSFMDNTAVLSVCILPPWYRTPLAYGFYALFIAGLIVWGIRWVHLRHRREIERIEREKTLKLTRLKLDFFANVSHEFKTPLSLIIGYISQMLIHETDNEQKRQMQIVRQNADKLHTLINQMSNYKEEKDDLLLSDTFLPEFVREIFNQFEAAFREKAIEASFHTDNIPHIFRIDRVKMESVFTNLLSNALKFTGSGGHIRISVRMVNEDEQSFTAAVTVEDDGCGISAADLPKVFDRYFMSSASRSLNKEGSGIGLSIAREIVRQHGGNITIHSEEGKGTRMTVTLTTSKTIAFVKNSSGKIRQDVTGEKPTVLLVEDNREIRDFITGHLSGHFHFLTAGEGHEGLQIAAEQLPQLVITDLMMPGTDGETLGRTLRNNVNTAFIPIIVLTARNDSQTELAAYEYADAFVTKPFDLNYLCRLSEKLIAKSRKIAEKARQKEIITPQTEEIVSPDEQFLKQITAIIEESLSDPDLNVTTLCRKSGMNDKQVYRKIKQLTGMSVVEYIRSIRLKKAAMFLRQDKLSVSEIMYLVGFSNASYFTRCFREAYGLSPKEFARSNF